HLYAVTVALVVLLPRAAMALFDFVQERRQQADFPIALDEAYFAALGRAHRGEATPVAVLPYNHEPPARTVPTLERLLGPPLGGSLALTLLPAVPYGQEEAAADAFAESGPLALVALLVSS